VVPEVMLSPHLTAFTSAAHLAVHITTTVST
jgi:hypothetical protein